MILGGNRGGTFIIRMIIIVSNIKPDLCLPHRLCADGWSSRAFEGEITFLPHVDSWWVAYQVMSGAIWMSRG